MTLPSVPFAKKMVYSFDFVAFLIQIGQNKRVNDFIHVGWIDKND